MINLLFDGQISLFIIILIALIISLTFHEFGHAWSAKMFGDDTAERAGRLTLNPVAHIDPAGLLMVMFVGFGYAKPVPTDPRNFKSPWASPTVAFAGPGMNLLLAVITVNIYVVGLNAGIEFFNGPGPQFFFLFLAKINLLLMLFNMIPLGALDGHYILAHFLPRDLSWRYLRFNNQYGNMLLLGLIVLSIMGLPIFHSLFGFAQYLLQYLVLV
ncbi:MAG: site-2 protease family protein [Gammaproteobacteria bacterium]|nr:site-2 protease family protein [Gammaproteobacteria bacterium]